MFKFIKINGYFILGVLSVGAGCAAIIHYSKTTQKHNDSNKNTANSNDKPKQSNKKEEIKKREDLKIKSHRPQITERTRSQNTERTNVTKIQIPKKSTAQTTITYSHKQYKELSDEITVWQSLPTEDLSEDMQNFIEEIVSSSEHHTVKQEEIILNHLQMHSEPYNTAAEKAQASLDVAKNKANDDEIKFTNIVSLWNQQQAIIDKINTDIQSLNSQKTPIKDEIIKKEQEIQSIKNTTTTQTQDINNKIDSYLSTLKSDLSSCQSSIDELSEKIEDLKKPKQGNLQVTDDSASEIATQEEKLANHQQNKKQIEDHITALESQKADWSSYKISGLLQNNTLETEIKTYISSLVSWTKEQSDLEQQIVVLENNKEELEKKIKEQTLAQKTATDLQKSMAADKKLKTQAHQKSQAELADATRAYSTATTAHKQLQKAIKYSEDRLQDKKLSYVKTHAEELSKAQEKQAIN